MTARTSLRLLAVLDVLFNACQAARASSWGPLTHFASPRGEKCRLPAQGSGNALWWKGCAEADKTHYAAETARGSRRFRLAWCAVNGNAKGDRAAPALADIIAGIPPSSHERFAGLDRPSTTTACCHKPL